MGEWVRTRRAPDGKFEYRFRYEFEDVARLMGLREGRGNTGLRHITVVDLMSLARDPGGPMYRRDLAYDIEQDQRGRSRKRPVGDPQAWMGRRGPLNPQADAALVLWDFLRGVQMLRAEDGDVGLLKQGVIALKAFGFSHADVAELLHLSPSKVTRILWGGREEPGAVSRVHKEMNGVRR